MHFRTKLKKKKKIRSKLKKPLNSSIDKAQFSTSTKAKTWTGTDPLRGRGGHPPPPPPNKKTISLINLSSILDDSYFRVYSWSPSNFWIGPNNSKETNHLTLSLGPWPLHSPNTTQ